MYLRMMLQMMYGMKGENRYDRESAENLKHGGDYAIEILARIMGA